MGPLQARSHGCLALASNLKWARDHLAGTESGALAEGVGVELEVEVHVVVEE